MKAKSLLPLLCVLVALTGCTREPQSASEPVAKSIGYDHGVSISHWMSTLVGESTFADPEWFDADDVAWIAAQGFDHVQIFVESALITNADHTLNPERLAQLDTAIDWCQANSLGALVTLTSLPKFELDPNAPQEQRRQQSLALEAAFWEQLAAHFAKRSNEAVRLVVLPMYAAPEMLPREQQAVLGAIRKSNPQRKVYLTYGPPTTGPLELPVDANVIPAMEISMEPAPGQHALDAFVLQGLIPLMLAGSAAADAPVETFPTIAFPDTVPTFTPALLEGDMAWLGKHSGTVLDERYLDSLYTTLAAAFPKRSRPALHVFQRLSFTDFPFDPDSVDAASTANFANAFKRATRRNDISFTIYDYNSGSAMRQPDGEATPILKGLQPL